MPDAPVSVPDPPDPADRMFLELGLRGEAGYLVTGDRPLRRWSAVAACHIVTPEEFRQALGVLVGPGDETHSRRVDGLTVMTVRPTADG